MREPGDLEENTAPLRTKVLVEISAENDVSALTEELAADPTARWMSEDRCLSLVLF